MGRTKKPTSELIKSGSYREDRHGSREELPVPVLPVGTTVAPPASIKMAEVKAAWKTLVRELVGNKLLTEADLVLLEQGFVTLENIKKLDRSIASIEGEGIIDKLDVYAKLVTSRKKMMDTYAAIMAKYFVTPMARTHMVKNRNDDSQKTDLERIIAGVSGK